MTKDNTKLLQDASINNTLSEENSSLLYKQAYYNSLTGLPNRLNLINTLDEYKNHYLLLLNIDEFNLINDFYGHTVGDNVLKSIASLLKGFSSLHNTLIYKLPVDEFALIVEKKSYKKRTCVTYK
ncbi:MAG: diguanylate cyclase [Sulfurimonas sp.]|nr:diguanylate cyclase [Sulfurimonas sp.]